ncbi:hypothetical protein SK1NUM_08770 [Arachnia rubra]|nr:hypothetical protein SK1NUM_08770 [Arachnia rubra]
MILNTNHPPRQRFQEFLTAILICTFLTLLVCDFRTAEGRQGLGLDLATPATATFAQLSLRRDPRRDLVLTQRIPATYGREPWSTPA